MGVGALAGVTEAITIVGLVLIILVLWCRLRGIERMLTRIDDTVKRGFHLK